MQGAGAIRAAHRMAEKLKADLQRCGPMTDTPQRNQIRREQRKAAKVAGKRGR